MGYGHVEWQAAGEAAYEAVGAAYGSVMQLTRDVHGLIILNNLDKAVALSFDGTADHFLLAAGEPLVLNLFAMNVKIAAGTIYIKHRGDAPTKGSLRITPIR
jgi:hypothetical protein